MAIHFACPWCTQTISVDDSKVHERIECPYCNRPVKVPKESTPDLPPPLPLPSQVVEGPQPVGVGGSFHPMRRIVEFIFPKRIHRLSFLVRFLATNLPSELNRTALSDKRSGRREYRTCNSFSKVK